MKHAFGILIIFMVIGVMASVFAIAFNLKSFTGKLPNGEGGVFLSRDGKVFKKINSTAGLEVLSILFSKMRPGTIYLGTKKYGLWISTDNGETFQTSKNKMLNTNIDIYDIAENPAGDLYLAAYRQNRGSVIWLSGEEAKEIYFSLVDNFGVFGVHLQNGAILIVSSDGGFYESKNNGKSWAVKSRSEKEGLLKLDVERSSGQIFVLTSESRIIKSRDGGLSWSDVSPNRNFYLVPKINSVLLDQNTNSLLAASDKIYKSADSGETWKALNLILPPDSIPISFAGINPANSDIIYAGSGNLLYKSVDGGKSWSFIKIPTSRKMSIIAFGQDPRLTVIGTSR